jgi:hypothetical protein
MPYIIRTITYPSHKRNDVIKKYLEIRPKYPQDESLGEFIAQPVTTTKNSCRRIPPPSRSPYRSHPSSSRRAPPILGGLGRSRPPSSRGIPSLREIPKKTIGIGVAILMAATLGFCGFLSILSLINNGGGSNNGGIDYNIYFGDLHAHSNLSDGSGPPSQAYQMSKDNGLDFQALTDHNFPRHNNPDYDIGKNTWESIDYIGIDDQYTDSSFVAIWAYEYTMDDGHINTFNTPIYVSHIISLTGYYDELISMTGSISQFNHPYEGDGSNFLNWGHLTSARDKKIQMCEIIGGGTLYTSDYQDALDAGWHVAPTANSDTHDANWGAHSYRTALLAPKLTRNSLYQAMRQRRCYATQEDNLNIYYYINDAVMGSIIDSAAQYSVTIEINDPDVCDCNDKISKIEIISKNGQVVSQENADAWDVTYTTTLQPTSDTYYYVRVTNSGGLNAWTAPIWISP